MIDPMMQAQMQMPTMDEQMGQDQIPGAMSAMPDPSAAGASPGPQPEPAESGVAQAPVPAPEPFLDPVSAAIDSVLSLDPQEAVRRVYQLSVSAARGKAKVDAAGERLDVRQYHAVLSATPEVRYARELIAARRRLDTLAAERRRLGLELGNLHSAGKGSGVLAAQYAAAEMAMEQVARGMLLFLALPSPDQLGQYDQSDQYQDEQSAEPTQPTQLEQPTEEPI